MTKPWSHAELEPLSSSHDCLFEIRAGSNCMGMATFEYSFSYQLDDILLEKMDLLKVAVFPFSKEGRLVKINQPNALLIEGILGLYRLKITLRIGANIDNVRGAFEKTLAKALSACSA